MSGRLEIRVTLPPSSLRALTWGIWAINLVLIFANFNIHLGGQLPSEIATHQLDMNQEANLASWYSSMLLTLAAVFAAVNYHVRAHVDGRWRFGWLAVAALALGLSADQVAQVHETIGAYVRAHAALLEETLPAGYLWVLVLGPLAAAAATFLFLFFRRVLAPIPHCRRLALAGVTLWVSAIALEALAVPVFHTVSIGESGQLISAPYSIAYALEESSELLGTTLLLLSFIELAAQPAIEFAARLAAVLAAGEARQAVEGTPVPPGMETHEGGQASAPLGAD
jgi:hypothetical protein